MVNAPTDPSFSSPPPFARFPGVSSSASASVLSLETLQTSFRSIPERNREEQALHMPSYASGGNPRRRARSPSHPPHPALAPPSVRSSHSANYRPAPIARSGTASPSPSRPLASTTATALAPTTARASSTRPPQFDWNSWYWTDSNPPPLDVVSSHYYQPLGSFQSHRGHGTAASSEHLPPLQFHFSSVPPPNFMSRETTSLAPQAVAMPAEKHSEPQHRVHQLSCSHCGAFISDRGMRAVLLLRPSITLFSTDAMPSNCGPLTPECYGDGAMAEVERTCDCLTQSLACYGCGNVIGYHIIHPCSRCVDSVSQQQRSANGHRWVFHYGEVVSRERRYMFGEPGITVPRSLSAAGSTSRSRTGTPPVLATGSTGAPLPEQPREGDVADVSIPLLEKADPMLVDVPDVPRPLTMGESAFARLERLRRNQSAAQACNEKEQVREGGVTPMLREGDVLYWSMLASAGERAPPVDPHTRVTSRPAR